MEKRGAEREGSLEKKKKIKKEKIILQGMRMVSIRDLRKLKKARRVAAFMLFGFAIGAVGGKELAERVPRADIKQLQIEAAEMQASLNLTGAEIERLRVEYNAMLEKIPLGGHPETQEEVNRIISNQIEREKLKRELKPRSMEFRLKNAELGIRKTRYGMTVALLAGLAGAASGGIISNMRRRPNLGPPKRRGRNGPFTKFRNRGGRK